MAKKANNGERSKTISLRPFPFELKLITTTNLRKTEIAVRHKHADYCSTPVADKRTGALALHAKNLSTMHILMPYKCDVGYITHEVWHIVRAMLLYSGATLDNEVVAYYLGWLSREAIRFNFEATKARDKAIDKPVEVVVE